MGLKGFRHYSIDEGLEAAIDGVKDLIPSRIRRSKRLSKRFKRFSQKFRSVSDAETATHNISKGESSESLPPSLHKAETIIYEPESSGSISQSFLEEETIIPDPESSELATEEYTCTPNPNPEASPEDDAASIWTDVSVHTFCEEEEVSLPEPEAKTTFQQPEFAPVLSLFNTEAVSSPEAETTFQQPEFAPVLPLFNTEAVSSPEAETTIQQPESAPVLSLSNIETIFQYSPDSVKSLSKAETTIRNPYSLEELFKSAKTGNPNTVHRSRSAKDLLKERVRANALRHSKSFQPVIAEEKPYSHPRSGWSSAQPLSEEETPYSHPRSGWSSAQPLSEEETPYSHPRSGWSSTQPLSEEETTYYHPRSDWSQAEATIHNPRCRKSLPKAEAVIHYQEPIQASEAETVIHHPEPVQASEAETIIHHLTSVQLSEAETVIHHPETAQASEADIVIHHPTSVRLSEAETLTHRPESSDSVTSESPISVTSESPISVTSESPISATSESPISATSESTTAVIAESPINEPKVVKISRRQRCGNKIRKFVSSTQEFIAPLKTWHPNNRPEKGHTRRSEERFNADMAYHYETIYLYFDQLEQKIKDGLAVRNPKDTLEASLEHLDGLYSTWRANEFPEKSPEEIQRAHQQAQEDAKADYQKYQEEAKEDHLGVTGANPRTGVIDSSEEHITPVRRVRWAIDGMGWRSLPLVSRLNLNETTKGLDSPNVDEASNASF